MLKALRYNLPVLSLALLIGCAHSGTKKVTIDKSESTPDWVSDPKISYEKADKVFFIAKEEVRGDERLGGCYDLASLLNRENLLRSIADEVKGAIDNAQTSISENAENVLGKVRSGKWEGKIIGFRDVEKAFERYQLINSADGSNVERISCALLSEIKKSDYQETKRSVINKIVSVDPKLKEAITNKQIQFFTE